MEAHCDELAVTGELEAASARDVNRFTKAITNSWYSWLVLGKINSRAVSTIQLVNGKMNLIMNDLPTMEEAQLRLAPMIKKIDIELEQERASLNVGQGG